MAETQTAHVQPDEGAPRLGKGDDTNRPASGIGAILRELGIAVRHARFVPESGPGVRLDVQDIAIWLTPREVAALKLALDAAVRKATSA